MYLRNLLASASAATLLVAPIAAAAAPVAAPLSVTRAASAAPNASQQFGEDGAGITAGIMVAGIAAIGIIAVVTDDDNDGPDSA